MQPLNSRNGEERPKPGTPAVPGAGFWCPPTAARSAAGADGGRGVITAGSSHNSQVQFPGPTSAAASRAAVFLTYLDYYRTVIIEKVAALAGEDVGRSRLPSGWNPLELLQHLTYVERRWLEWGFEDPSLPDPGGDQLDGRWHVPPERSLDDIVAGLRERGARSRQIVESHDLTDVGRPGERWDDAPPATLERVLFHLLQEYARHAAHVDIVAELATGQTGE